MIDAELALSWDNFVSQSRLNEARVLELLASQGRSKETLTDEWKPASIKSIKSRLIINEIAEKEKLEATEDDVEKELGRQAELRGSTVEEVRELFEKNNSVEYLRRDLTDKKVFDLLLENAKITKGEKTTYVDLASKNQ
jgi:trigger factor